MQPATYSINALSVELGRDRRTLAKLLADVPPREVKGRERRWRLRDALRVLEPGPLRPAQAAETIRDFAMAGLPLKRGVHLVGWAELGEVLEADDDVLEELLRFGLPYVKRGDRAGRGWEFSWPHAARWLALWSGLLERLRLVGHGAELHEIAEATRRIAPPEVGA